MEGTKIKITALAIASLFAVAVVHAAPPAKKAAPDANKGFRKKELNFEERVIEGLSNRGYESLSQTGSNDGLKGEKLYRKRAEFDEDSKSLLREMEYLK
jgi:hypothetical protein